jgi:hypothetical protein
VTRPGLCLIVALAAGPSWAAPKLKSKAPEVTSLVGTRWTGPDGDLGEMTVEFKADGVMTYSYPGQPTRTATWCQDGAKVYFEINMKYREFNGVLKGNSLAGDSHNVAGKDWRTALTRVRDQ